MTAPLWGGPLFSEARRGELSPENVAQVVGWLVSPRSAPITGQIVSFGGRRISISQEWPTIGVAEAKDGIWTYEHMDRVRVDLFGAASNGGLVAAGPASTMPHGWPVI
jgi:hypothetical protein